MRSFVARLSKEERSLFFEKPHQDAAKHRRGGATPLRQRVADSGRKSLGFSQAPSVSPRTPAHCSAAAMATPSRTQPVFYHGRTPRSDEGWACGFFGLSHTRTASRAARVMYVRWPRTPIASSDALPMLHPCAALPSSLRRETAGLPCLPVHSSCLNLTLQTLTSDVLT